MFQQVISRLRRNGSLRRRGNRSTLRKHLMAEFLEERRLLAGVVTDKLDYAPGSTAVIVGTGFDTGETVEFRVLHNDGTSNTGGGHEAWQVTDGSVNDLDGLLDGNVQTTWYVNPDDSADSSFDLTATGMGSGRVATTTFRDSGVLTFDDLSGTSTEIPTGYGGFDWSSSGSSYYSYPDLWHGGYGSAGIGGSQAAWTAYGGQYGYITWLGTGTVNIKGAYFANDSDSPNLYFRGYNNGVLVAQKSVYGLVASPTWVSLNFNGIDQLVVDSGLSGPPSRWWSMDNLTFGTNAVPAITNVVLSATSITENQSTTLSGSFTDLDATDFHTVTIDWGDGSAPTSQNLAAGVLSFSGISHTYLDDAPAGSPSDNMTISVTVSDTLTLGGTAISVSNAATKTIIVNDAAPVVNPLNVSHSNIDETGSTTLSGSFTDPGTLDIHTVTINWGGAEGSETFTLPLGQRSFSRTHQYQDDEPTNTNSDVYQISVTISDDDGGNDVSSEVGGTAPPAVAVLQGGNDSTFWTFSNLNPVMTSTPGSGPWSLTTIASSQLTAAGLAPYNALVINTNDRAFATAQVQADVASWVVSGGRLIIAPTFNLGVDPLTTSLGSDYRIDWSAPDWCGRSQLLVDATHPLLNYPNALDGSTDYSTGYASCDHVSINPGNLGSAWDEAAIVPSLGNVVTLASANAGAGAILAGAIHWDHRTEGQRKLAENMFRYEVSTPASVTVNNVKPVLNSVSATSEDEDGTVTLAGTYSDVGTLDTHTLTVDWGEGTPVTLPVSGGSFSFTHQYLDDDATNSPSDAYTINVTLTDDDMGFDVGSATTIITNVAPVITAFNAPTINENGTATITGSFTDVGSLDSHSVVIDWGDGFSALASVDPLTRTFVASHQYLDDALSPAASDIYSVTMTVTDDDMGSNAHNTTVTVNNLAPTLSVLAASAILENGTTTFSGTIADVGTLDTFTVEIDWDNNGTFDETHTNVGAGKFSYSHQYLDDNPTGTPIDNMPIRVKVTDDDTGSVSGSTTTTVSNVAPVILSLAANSVVENDFVHLTGTYGDAGTLDSHELTIDWGDGSVQTVPVSGGSFDIPHQYLDDDPSGTTSDNYEIVVTITDDDMLEPVSAAESMLYYGGPGAPSDGYGSSTSIGRVELDGTSDVSVIGSAGFVRDLEVDQAGGKVYWADASNPGGSNRVYRANLDGSAQEVIAVVDSGVSGIGLDTEDGQLYIGSTYRLYRANLDGTGLVQLKTGYLFNDLEVADHKLYWSSVYTINRSDLDGNNQTALVTGQQSIVGIDVVPSLGIFWADQSSGKVQAADLDGTDIRTIRTGDAGARGIAVDPSAGRVYWGRSGNIRTTALDGSDYRSFTVGASILGLDFAGTSSPTVIADTQVVSVTISNVAPVITAFNAPIINENGTATITGSFTDVGSLDSHSVVIDWGDGFSALASVDPLTRTFVASHQYLDDALSPAASDIYSVTMTVTDDDMGSNAHNTTVTVNNLAPTLSVLAASAILENGTTTFSGTIADVGTLDTFTVEIDWDNNGTFDETHTNVGAGKFSYSHQYLDDNPTGTPIDNMPIRVQVTDDDTGRVTGNTTVEVSNVAPTLSDLAATAILENGTTTFSGKIADVGSLDKFTVQIDWDNDGTFDETHTNVGAGAFSYTHQYLDDNPTGTPVDNMPIRVQVTDDDTGSAAGNTTGEVTNVAPTLSDLAATAILENGTTTFSGKIADVGSLDKFTVQIDWDNDGTFDETHTNVGAGAFSYTHQYLDDNPTGTPVDNMPIRVQVTDDDTGSAAGNTTVEVTNVAPTLSDLTASAISENGTTTFSGKIADVGSLDTFTVQIDWDNDGTFDETHTDVAAGKFSYSHQYLDDNPTSTPVDNMPIRVQVTDDDTGSVTGNTTVEVTNVAPVILSLAATSVDENGVVHLTGTYSDVGTEDTHTLTINWGEGVPQTVVVTGGSFDIPHQYLDDNPTATGSDVFTIGVTLVDDDTDSVSSSTTTTVTNVLPVMVDFNSSSPECGGAAEGDLISVLGVFTDIGTQDTHVATIDWGDGTGSASATVTEAAGSGTVTANHVYASGGIFTIALTLTDDDGGTIVKTAQAVITGAGVNNGILYVIGTDHDDEVTINAAKDTYKVHSNFYPSGAPFKTFDQAGITQIVVVMCDGNDQVQVAGNIVTPTILDGGEGDDKLNGGAGNNIIIGGNGADELLGGSGRDLLIGGVGSDNLTGNSGEDLLIAGWTDFDGNYAALAAIMAEWSRTDAANGSYEMRRDRLSGSQAGGLNGVNLLTTGAGGSVHDDAAADKLNGSSGRDLYFAEIGSGALDKLNGRANDESIFDLL